MDLQMYLISSAKNPCILKYECYPALYDTKMLWMQMSAPLPSHIHVVYPLDLSWVCLHIGFLTSMSELDIVSGV